MNLGRTPLRISKLGIGTLQWGDPGSGYGERYGEEQLASAFDELIKGGINFFDTAEVRTELLNSYSCAQELCSRVLELALLCFASLLFPFFDIRKNRCAGCSHVLVLKCSHLSVVRFSIDPFPRWIISYRSSSE